METVKLVSNTNAQIVLRYAGKGVRGMKDDKLKLPEVKRHDIHATFGDNIEAICNPKGEWVRYRDVKPLLDKIKELYAAIYGENWDQLTFNERFSINRRRTGL